MNDLFDTLAARSRACRPPRVHIPYAVAPLLGLRALRLGGDDRAIRRCSPTRSWASSASTGPTPARKAERELGYAPRAAARKDCGEHVEWLRARGPAPDAQPPAESCRARSSTSRSGGFALLLRDLTWPQAALMAVGALALQRSAAAADRRDAGCGGSDEHGARLSAGHPSLPDVGAGPRPRSSATTLWMAAAVWGVLALGDGMASHRRAGRRRPAAALEPPQGLGRAPRVRGLRHRRRGHPHRVDAAAARSAPGLSLGSWPRPFRWPCLRAGGIAAHDARRQPHGAAGRGVALRRCCAGGARATAPREPGLRSASGPGARGQRRFRARRLRRRDPSTGPGAVSAVSSDRRSPPAWACRGSR